MLTPEQVKAARQRMGITPAPTPQAQNVASELDSVWAEADSMQQSVVTPDIASEFDREMDIADRTAADIKSAEETRAFFPAKTTPDANMFDALKMIPNLPSSLAKNLVAPLEQLGQIPSGGIKDFGGGVSGALKLGAQTALEAPGAALQVGVDVAKGLASFFGIDKFATGNIEEGAEAFYRNLVNDPVGFLVAIQGIRAGGKGTAEAIKTGEISKGFEAGKVGLNEPIKLPTPGMGKVESAITKKIKGTPEVRKGKELISLKEKISPKQTVKEARLATEQGRMFKGREQTMFKGKTVDRISASDQQYNTVRTIDRLIPDHAKMDEATLHTVLKEKIGETAKALKPEMQKTPVQRETVQNMSSKWNEVKNSQIDEALGTEEVNVAKRQKKFEAIIKKVSEKAEGTMDDIWEARKAYDNSIKDNVKRATEQSPQSLQDQKAEWLENRRILSDAINDTALGMGETSKQAFLDMRDMYEGQSGIISKAKVDTKVLPAKAVEMTKDFVRGGAKAVVGAKILGI